MTFQEVVLSMYPYWILGFAIFFAVYFSEYRKFLRIETKPLKTWSLMLFFIFCYRAIVFHFFGDSDFVRNAAEGAMMIPWQTAFTVGWEDLVHTLPILITASFMGQDSWWKKLLINFLILISMISFGLGHVYQGTIAAIFLSLYVPYTYKKGQEFGVGTIIICHMLYDLTTILTLNLFLG